MPPKSKKAKLLRRATRGAERTRVLADNSERRIKKALKAISDNDYTLSKLADDLLGQWSDFFNVVSQFSGAGEDEVATAYFVTGPFVPPMPPNPVPPVPGETPLVSLTDTVDGGTIDWTDLTGPVIFPRASVQILDPLTGAPPLAGDDLDSVKVKVTALPTQVGTYQGVVTDGNTKVLARIVYVLKA